MLTVRGLCKSYGDVVALHGVDLDVPRGRIVSLLGPNGAGKTTLVSIVAGLRRADSGTVRVGDVDALAQPRLARRLIGLAPQDLGVYPIVTVRQNLTLFGELAGLRRAELRARVDDVAEALALSPLVDRLVGTLSGGEKRRLHTAIALLHRPPLLLLDEATVGADVETRAELLRLVQELAAEGSAILYSTHYLHEVEALEADVAILDRGRLVARGAVRELIRQHGRGIVELVFDGPPPRVAGATAVQDGTVRVVSDRPAAALARVLRDMGPDADRIHDVEVLPPSLESVFVALTGRRYAREDTAEEAVHVTSG